LQSKPAKPVLLVILPGTLLGVFMQNNYSLHPYLFSMKIDKKNSAAIQKPVNSTENHGKVGKVA